VAHRVPHTGLRRHQLGRITSPFVSGYHPPNEPQRPVTLGLRTTLPDPTHKGIMRADGRLRDGDGGTGRRTAEITHRNLRSTAAHGTGIHSLAWAHHVAEGTRLFDGRRRLFRRGSELDQMLLVASFRT
jgi:hypothetical protein